MVDRYLIDSVHERAKLEVATEEVKQPQEGEEDHLEMRVGDA